MKKTDWRQLREDPKYRIEQDWAVGLFATLGDGQKIRKIFFYLQGFFREQLIVPYSWGSNVE